MSEPPLVSVCVPTYKRPGLLEEVVRSIAKQDYRPLEILIGDDSPEPLDVSGLEEIARTAGTEVRYEHHTPAKRQADNVNSLYDRARGHWCVLIHDDDLLLDGAISALVHTAIDHPDAVMVYGMQRIISHEGVDQGDEAAREINSAYHRTLDALGPQKNPLASGLLRQVPNNGYLVRSSLAREVRCRPESVVGYACDTDFAIRLGALSPPGSFVLIDHETSAYRITEQSVLRDGKSMAASYLYDIIESMETPDDTRTVKAQVLGYYASGALREHALRGNRRRAFSIWWKEGLYRRGLKNALVGLAWILLPQPLERLRRRAR